MRNSFKIWVVGFLLCSLSLYGQKMKKLPAAEEILERSAQISAGVEDFSATIDVELQMDRMQIPPMHAVMYFKHPDKLHFDSQGFLFLPKDGLVLNPRVLRERYSVADRSLDTIDGRRQYKLLLVAKNKEAHLLRLNAWIDAEMWTLRKIETTPYEGRVLTLLLEYALASGKYWMPVKTIASFSSVTEIDRNQNDFLDMKKDAIGQGPKSPTRNGMVTITYSQYKINMGLNDSLFVKKELQGKQ